jgi:hypothetical protein
MAVVTLKYATKCAKCGAPLLAGTQAEYQDKKSYCTPSCKTSPSPAAVPAGNSEVELYRAAIGDIAVRLRALKADVDALHAAHDNTFPF